MSIIPEQEPEISIADFERAEIRVGRIVQCDPFPEARKPSVKLVIDFGPLGLKYSSAQLTTYYEPADLVGTLVIAVVNFPPRRIAGFSSEVLVLGVPGEGIQRLGGVVLLRPDREVSPGARVF